VDTLVSRDGVDQPRAALTSAGYTAAGIAAHLVERGVTTPVAG
jgi:hypothetical protein